MKLEDISTLVDALAPVVKQYVEAEVDRRVTSVLAASGLNEKGARAMTFHGAWLPGKTFPPGAVVQKANASFVALIETTEAPGASDAWRRVAGA